MSKTFGAALSEAVLRNGCTVDEDAQNFLNDIEGK
jgi:hypothetical protein